MRSSILREIESLKGITHALVLTHDVDFLFLQGLVLRALKSAGEPVLTVFADAERAATSFASQGALAAGLGQRYRLVPVALASGGRFHPKAVLLAGPDGATLFVGSGNLTFGGWCDNGEVWSRFRTTEGEGAAVAAFKAYLDELVATLPLSDVLRSEIEAIFDPTSRAWANPLPQPDHLVGRLGTGPSLLSRLGERIRGERLTVCTPYFDPDGQALLRLADATGASQVEVLTQESSTNLLSAALAGWPAHVRARPADYVHTDEKGERRRARLHAKWMLSVTGDRAIAVVGSANCSRAALTTTGSVGNAELVVLIDGQAAELFDLLRAEIEVLDRALQLPEVPPESEEDDEPGLGEPVVLAARYDMGTLRVAVGARGAFEPQQIEADGLRIPTQQCEGGELVAFPDATPRRVCVHGLRAGEPWATSELWVDVEALLRGSAGRRRLVDLVRQSQQSGRWTIEVWADLIDAAFEELATPTAQGGGGPRRQPPGDDPAQTWHREDVFLSTYCLPRHAASSGPGSEADVVSSTLALLFNWSAGEEGVDRLDPDSDDEPDDIDPRELEAGEDEDGEAPPPRPIPPQQEIAAGKAARHQQHALVVLQKMLDSLADPAFLGTRSPADIRRAIIMLALLLRTGLQQKWIRSEDFFAVTQRAWRTLFFSGRATENRGDLAARLDREEDPDSFRVALATPRLAAALAAWGLAAHGAGKGHDLALFDLTCAVSAAHHPWMWRGAPLDRISEELHRLLRHTHQAGEDKALGEWWARVQRRGAALAALEGAISDAPLADLRGRLGAWEVEPGALLWQGSAGWCVVEQSARSQRPRDKVAVRKLQGDESEKHFVASFLVPLEPLVASIGDHLSEPDRAELRALIADVAAAYGGPPFT